MKPYTDETIVELGQKGVKSLLAVPIRYLMSSNVLLSNDISLDSFGKLYNADLFDTLLNLDSQLCQ